MTHMLSLIDLLLYLNFQGRLFKLCELARLKLISSCVFLILRSQSIEYGQLKISNLST